MTTGKIFLNLTRLKPLLVTQSWINCFRKFFLKNLLFNPVNKKYEKNINIIISQLFYFYFYRSTGKIKSLEKSVNLKNAEDC